MQGGHGAGPPDAPVAIAVAARPYPGEPVSGDGWTVEWHAGVCRIAVIDGLGHGAEAAAAAMEAVRALIAHPEADPLRALEICHAALAGTRGAAIAIAAIDPVRSTLTYAGIGNIEAQLAQAGRVERPISYRGIAGGTVHTTRAATIPLMEGWLLAMHSDGVSARFTLTDFPLQPGAPAEPLARAILEQWGRTSDDATVLVAAPRALENPTPAFNPPL